MPTANEQTPNYFSAFDGTVPNLTWSQLTNSFAQNNDPNSSNGWGNVSGLGGVSASRQATAGTGGGESGSGNGFYGGSTYSGAYDTYFQPTDSNHANYYSQNPDGTVSSHNQTINDDSYLSKLIFDKILPTAIIGTVGAGLTGGALAGSGLLGEGAAAAAAPSSTGTLFGLGGGADAGAAATSSLGGSTSNLFGLQDVSGSFPEGYDGAGFSNVSADAGAANAADGVTAEYGTGGLDVAAPTDGTVGSNSYLQSLQNLGKQYGFGNGPIGSVSNIFNGTGQIGDYLSTASNLNTADSLLNQATGTGDAATTSIPGVSTSSGGGPSGTGLSFSDAANSAATGTDYSGGVSDLDAYLSRLQNNPLSTIGGTLSDLNSGLKSSTGISGVQALAGLLDGYNKSSQNSNNINTRNTLNSLFSPTGAYASQLQQSLERRDAAAGRQSQYGPRQVELESKLAQLQAGVLNSSNYSNLNSATPLNGIFNSLYASYNQNQATDQGAAALTNLLTKYFGSGGST